MSGPRPLGIVLSGGAGRRLDRADKGLKLYRNRPLVQWVIDALQAQAHGPWLCINRNHDQYLHFGCPLVSDTDPDYQGPMAGLVAVIAKLDSLASRHRPQTLLVTSCDTPDLPQDYGSKLEQALIDNDTDVAVVHDGRRKQNLHCLIRVDALASLNDFYSNGGRAMHRWFDQVNLVEVDFTDQAAAFRNLNTADQFE